MKRSHRREPPTHLHSGEHRPSPGSPQAVQDEIRRSRDFKPMLPPTKASARLGHILPASGRGKGGGNFKRHPITLSPVLCR